MGAFCEDSGTRGNNSRRRNIIWNSDNNKVTWGPDSDIMFLRKLAFVHVEDMLNNIKQERYVTASEFKENSRSIQDKCWRRNELHWMPTIIFRGKGS